MEAYERREKIWRALQSATSPITASQFASALGVSRQVIVGDVSVLRASGASIRSTSRGYEFAQNATGFPYVGTVTSRHTEQQLAQELQIIVDYGGTCIDVSIDHAFYGELTGKLDIASRYDIECFLARLDAAEKEIPSEKTDGKIATENNGTGLEDANRALPVASKPLSALTDGLHRHRIGCPNEKIFHLIEQGLRDAGILLE